MCRTKRFRADEIGKNERFKCNCCTWPQTPAAALIVGNSTSEPARSGQQRSSWEHRGMFWLSSCIGFSCRLASSCDLFWRELCFEIRNLFSHHFGAPLLNPKKIVCPLSTSGPRQMPFECLVVKPFVNPVNMPTLLFQPKLGKVEPRIKKVLRRRTVHSKIPFGHGLLQSGQIAACLKQKRASLCLFLWKQNRRVYWKAIGQNQSR